MFYYYKDMETILKERKKLDVSLKICMMAYS